jgi:hypothetical protein
MADVKEHRRSAVAGAESTNPHHMGKVRVEGSILEILPSPGQECVAFDLREHDVPVLDAWP